jgi:toxin ParE2
VTVRFLDIAEIELDEAIHWYDQQALGLGDAFLVEVLAAARRITLYPEAWHPLGDGIRRCRLTRFPADLYGRQERYSDLGGCPSSPKARLLA